MTHDLQVDITQAEQENRARNEQESSGCPVSEMLAFLHIILHRLTSCSWNIPSKFHEL